MTAHKHRLRVRYNECDAQGVVFNANYLMYFDIAVTELWREAFGGWNKVIESGVDNVVAEATVRYRASLRFDDEVELSAAVGHLGESSMVVELAIDRDGTRAAEGEIRYVFIEPGGSSKTAIPDEIRAALAPFAPAEG